MEVERRPGARRAPIGPLESFQRVEPSGEYKNTGLSHENRP